LDEAYGLWGAQEDCAIYVFTDGPLSDNHWGPRAHVWMAPPAGDNAAIIALAAERRGSHIRARCTLANYGRAARTLRATVIVNDVPRGGFECRGLGPGATAEQTVDVDEPRAAALRIKLEGGPDALAVDDEACAVVPALADLGVRLVWPEGGKHNAYVGMLLASLQEEGTIGPVWESPAGTAAVTVFANQLPATWPEGGAVVLYPLRSGVVEVAGLHAEPVTVTRQAAHFVLEGVELRGLVVKGAVQAKVPDWAEPLVWADDLPLVWAGATGKTKVLFVAAPLTPDGSRLPLLAAFPMLVRNACLWMLPQASVLRPGEAVDGDCPNFRPTKMGLSPSTGAASTTGPPPAEATSRALWTSRRAGLVESPADGRLHAFSTLSAAESDLRRSPREAAPPPATRQSLATLLVVLAMLLLLVEWGLFHRRLTE
jgi:hypothetical protein